MIEVGRRTLLLLGAAGLGTFAFKSIEFIDGQQKRIKDVAINSHPTTQPTTEIVSDCRQVVGPRIVCTQKEELVPAIKETRDELQRAELFTTLGVGGAVVIAASTSAILFVEAVADPSLTSSEPVHVPH